MLIGMFANAQLANTIRMIYTIIMIPKYMCVLYVKPSNQVYLFINVRLNSSI